MDAVLIRFICVHRRLNLIVHSEYRAGVAFVAVLVDFLFASVAAIETVRAVDHDAVDVADVLIRMDHTRRYQHRGRIIRAHHQRRRATKCFRILAIVPKPQLEIRGTEKTKEVSLIDVLVRSTRDAWIRRRDIRHHRKKLRLQTVVTKKLSQPAARVESLCQTINDYSLDLTVSKAVGHWQLPLEVRYSFCWPRFRRPGSTPATNSRTFPHRSTSLRALPTSSHRARCKRC